MKVQLMCLFFFVFLVSAQVNGQAQHPKPNLTTVLNQLSSTHGVRFSFSPSLTDKVFPEYTRVTGEIGVVLRQVLKGTGFAFRLVNNAYYYIYKDPKSVVLKEPQSKTLPLNKKKKEKAKEDKETEIKLREVSLPMPAIIKPEYHSLLPGRDTVVTLLEPVPVLYPTVIKFKEDLPNSLMGIKTNMIYATSATLNLGVEIGLMERVTLDFSINYNPWTYSENRKMKHWMMQPELRYWNCKRFNGSFWALHAHYGQYNWGGMLPWGIKPSQSMKDHRYEGQFVGAGIGYGYHWVVGRRWGVEATIGAGYTYLKYDKFRCPSCGEKTNKGQKHYWGVTKAAVTLIFMIK